MAFLKHTCGKYMIWFNVLGVAVCTSGMKHHLWSEDTNPVPPAEDVGSKIVVMSAQQKIDFKKGLVLWKTDVRINMGSSLASGNIRELFAPAPKDLKKVHWLLVEYPPVSCPSVADALQENLPKLLFDISKDTILIYKEQQADMRSRLTSGKLEPTNVFQAKFTKGQGKTAAKEAQMNIVRSSQSLPGEHNTNMVLEKEEQMSQYKADALFDLVNGMTTEEFTKACINARLALEDERTKLETFLVDTAIECRLKELRRIQGTNVTNVIYATKVKGLVQSASIFKDRWETLQVTVHDPSLLTPTMPIVEESQNKVTLKTFIEFTELHQNTTLVFLGTTKSWQIGIGKTCLLAHGVALFW